MGIPDRDGDGCDELLVVQTGSNPDPAVYLFSGAALGPATSWGDADAVWTYTGGTRLATRSFLDGSPMAVGDLDGDGLPDFVIGEDYQSSGVGMAFVALSGS